MNNSTPNSDKFRIIATKLSPWADERVDALAAKRGLSRYELLQMVCDTLIRYMDDAHNLTPEMEQVMSVFEHMDGWKGAFNLADPTTDPQITEATYYLRDPRHQGTRAIHVDLPFMGQVTQTANIQQIFERTVCLLTFERYRRLRALAVDMGCNSLLELIDRLIDFHASEADLQTMRDAFADNDRSDYGAKPTGTLFRSTHRTTIEDLDSHPQLFDAEP